MQIPKRYVLAYSLNQKNEILMELFIIRLKNNRIGRTLFTNVKQICKYVE